MKPRKVLVTGGNGHVGNTLAKKLCEKGYDVRVTVRNPEEVEAFGIFDGYQVDLRQADIRDETAVKKAMEGVSGVFQVAAVYNYDERSLGEGIVANNKEGSQTVLRLAKTCGVERVVFTSSIAAVGFDGTKEQPLTEENWSDPADPYCRSKLESERVAWEYARGQGLNLVALCPSIILGPNFYKHTPSTVNVAALINNQIPFRVPMQLSVVDVRDVADAHVLAYENRNASGRYLVTGTNIPDLIAALSELDPEMVVPERTLTPEEVKELAEKSGMPVELVGQSFLYSDKKIQSDLGWKPRRVAETLQDTIAWIKSREL
jgi:nucleoside-diphosphate-sugar epimerase